MAMEINSIYNNVYESAYAAQKQESVKKNETSKMEEAQKNSGTESGKAKSTAEYMKGLEKLAPSVEFRIGNGCATDKTGKTLTINPKLLEKMQSDPKMEKKMKELIAGVEKMTKFDESRCSASGRVLVYKHSYIDANGKYCHTAMTIQKDELNEKLRKQAEENAKKQVEKTRENSRKRTEQLEEKLEEKSEEAKNSQSPAGALRHGGTAAWQPAAHMPIDVLL